LILQEDGQGIIFNDTIHRDTAELKQSDSITYCDVEYTTVAVIVGRGSMERG
jgi:hypothetical protein